MDLRLQADGGDVDMTNGSLSLVDGTDAIAQHMAARLRTWQTESPYDRRAGMPWLQLADLSAEAVQFFAEEQIAKTPGVVELVERVSITVDSTTRGMTATGRVRVITGDVVSFSIALTEEL